LHRTERIICDDEFAKDLEEFFNADRDDIHKAIIDRRLQEEGFDPELD
jgi:hypothetical protein